MTEPAAAAAVARYGALRQAGRKTRHDARASADKPASEYSRRCSFDDAVAYCGGEVLSGWDGRADIDPRVFLTDTFPGRTAAWSVYTGGRSVTDFGFAFLWRPEASPVPGHAGWLLVRLLGCTD